MSADRRPADPKRPFSERNGKLMTPVEVADYLGITERQVRRMVGTDELAPTYVRKLLRIHIDDVENYIKQHRRAAAQ